MVIGMITQRLGVSRFIPVLLLIANIFFAMPAQATEKTFLPDFYSEPGLSPFRNSVNANVTENIDPFSGNLNLSIIDLVVPGNGGLDIKVQRSYNANDVYVSHKTQTNLAPSLTELTRRTPTGLGWSLHFGRILKTENQGSGQIFGICNDTSINGANDTLNNAILELPDGSRSTLFVNSTSFSALFITKEQWVATCISDGLLVISPEGTKYTMNFHLVGPGPVPTDITIKQHAWYTTQIEDRNGNKIFIAYDTTAAPTGLEPVFKQITARNSQDASNDGRVVDFFYTNRTDSNNIRLTSIVANNQTWTYEYTAATNATGYYQLTRVVRPESPDWIYSYYNRADGAAGNRILNTVTYPYGAIVTYDYGYVCFLGTTCTSANETFFSLVVTTKTNGGRDVAPGTWTYSYAPSTTEDVTTITFPGGSYVYRHFGSKMFFGGATICGQSIWKTGLLKQKQTFNGGSLIDQETYTWQPLNNISNEEYVRPPYDGSDGNHPRYSDCSVFAPVLTQKQVIRDGTTYTTTYSNFDVSFNPRTVTESGQASRTTNLTYFPRTAGQNIVHLVKDETLSGFGAEKGVFRTYDGLGNPTQVIRHGVTDNYNYHATGDLNNRINSRAQIWSYNNYSRGIPANENHPEGVMISRIINNTGTIASETNGRGFATSFTYDGLNRIKTITRPINTPISVSSSTTGRTVTRGSYTQTTTFDGFGRPSFINTNGITKDINYNTLGYKSFESYYSTTAGDSFSTDVLGRVTAISHPDSTSRAYTYSAGNVVSIRNERNFTTAFSYRSFGNPDNTTDKVLMRIDAPEGVSTVFTRDILGLPTNITQGGIPRSYGYSPTNNFLVSETNPETGVTSYGRDAVGNMTSRQFGSSPSTTYGYDGLNRLRTIDYPGTTPDVTMSYDGNNNLTLVDNGVSRRTFNYDSNDNLTSETLTASALSFTAAYAYNGLDYLTSITYPSLRQVSYAPDALGRPTAVSPYINTVSHHPNGVPANLAYVNGQAATLGLNNRQWISSISAQKAGVGFAEDLGYGYDGIGNVTSLTNTLDATDSKSMSYDGLDRLVVAGAATISYDPTGNITAFNTTAGSLSYGYDGTNRLTNVSGRRTNNFSYDVYGNIAGNGSQSFTYDDAGNLRAVSGITTYDYDGKNMRVSAQKNGQTNFFFYGHNGNLLGEYDSAGTWKKEYAYLGSKLVTTVENVPDVAPSPPSNITVPASSDTGNYTLNWGTATANGTPVTRYELQEAADNTFLSPTLVFSGLNLSASIAGKPNGAYYYRVRACSGTACSGYQTGANGVVVNIPPPPAGVPSSISVPTSSSTGTYTVSWGTATGAVTRYELQEATDSAFASPTLIYSGLNLSASIAGKPNGTYYYRVRACNGTGCSNYRTASNAVVVSIPVPIPNLAPLYAACLARNGDETCIHWVPRTSEDQWGYSSFVGYIKTVQESGTVPLYAACLARDGKENCRLWAPRTSPDQWDFSSLVGYIKTVQVPGTVPLYAACLAMNSNEDCLRWVPRTTEDRWGVSSLLGYVYSSTTQPAN